ncbi:MAG: hypothetical protein O2917_11940, partial [Acidobacteria bacterium]|nr:hypothetical protein [Acidobacteriota bacterium]
MKLRGWDCPGQKELPMLTAARQTPLVPHVVCLGGGYVAIYLARALRREIRAGRLRLTVVCDDNFHCFHGLVP